MWVYVRREDGGEEEEVGGRGRRGEDVTVDDWREVGWFVGGGFFYSLFLILF